MYDPRCGSVRIHPSRSRVMIALAHGDATHAHGRGDLVLGQSLSGLQLTVEDQSTHVRGDGIGARLAPPPGRAPVACRPGDDGTRLGVRTDQPRDGNAEPGQRVGQCRIGG